MGGGGGVEKKVNDENNIKKKKGMVKEKNGKEIYNPFFSPLSS